MAPCAEKQREAQMARYRDYQRLIDETGEDPQWNRWASHRRELLQDRNEWVDRRYTREELKDWWLARYTLKEIREMAGALDFLNREQAA